MTTKITIDPITRLEGHGRIDIFIDDAGEVERAYFVVPELRGFEVFARGRPAEDMPQITSRICGVCPTAHHMASSKTVDDLWKVDPPRSAKLIRELMHNAFMCEDHALHFYVLAGADFIRGPTAPAAERNILGVVDTVGLEVGLKVIDARKKLRWILQLLGGKVIHPVAGLPGGMARPVPADELETLRTIASESVEFALFTQKTFHDLVLKNPEYVDLVTSEAFTHRTHYMGLVDDDNKVNFYDGKLRVVDPDGKEFVKFDVHDYANHIAEHVEPWTFVRFSHLKKVGWRGFVDGNDSGIVAVAPLGRLNAADGMATPKAQEAYEQFYDTLGGKPCHLTLATHWARIIEMIYAAERMVELLEDPEIVDQNVRNLPSEKPEEGIGVVEAPRGTLIHHYTTDERGILTEVNLLVATQHNAARIALSVDKAARALIKGVAVDEGTLNMIEMAFRAYDPCMACATHALTDAMPLLFSFRSSTNGKIIAELKARQ